jgi:acyl-CoA thioester hydrolase
VSVRAAVPPLVPAPGLVPPESLRVPHLRPFAMRLVAEPDSVSRAVAHVNNVEYVRWIDRAAELHADSLGYTRARLGDEGCMWFVARHEVDYRAEVFPGDELHVFTWVRTLGRSASWRDTEVVRARDGSASTCWAFVDLSTRRPARVPPEMRAAFDPLEPAACTLRSSSTPTGS